MKTCLNCNRSEQETPLVTLQYQGSQVYICTHCFPTLIHSPSKLSGNLKDADKIQPADVDH
jgi:hypothetical protein